MQVQIRVIEVSDNRGSTVLVFTFEYPDAASLNTLSKRGVLARKVVSRQLTRIENAVVITLMYCTNNLPKP